MNHIKCTKSNDAEVLVKDDEIKESWKIYLKLLNGNNVKSLEERMVALVELVKA